MAEAIMEELEERVADMNAEKNNYPMPNVNLPDFEKPFQVKAGNDPDDELLFDYDIMRLNLACRAIDKLNIQAAECAMMSDDEPIKLDDISVKINDSPPRHDAALPDFPYADARNADKEESKGFADSFKKVQEEKERSAERKKKAPLFPKNEEFKKKPLRGNPAVFGQKSKPEKPSVKKLEE